LSREIICKGIGGAEKKPAGKPGGPGGVACLESDRSTEDEPATCRHWEVDLAGDGIGNQWVAKTGARGKQASVFKKWIDTQEVGVVQDIDRCRAELERGALGEPEPLGNGKVADVGHGVLHRIPRHIPERRTEHTLCGSAVDDEANLIGRDRNDRA
jgi:hypothetical protein